MTSVKRTVQKLRPLWWLKLDLLNWEKEELLGSKANSLEGTVLSLAIKTSSQEGNPRIASGLHPLHHKKRFHYFDVEVNSLKKKNQVNQTINQSVNQVCVYTHPCGFRSRGVNVKVRGQLVDAGVLNSDHQV